MFIPDVVSPGAEGQARWDRWILKGEAHDRSVQYAIRTVVLGIGSFALMLLAFVLTVR